MNVFKDFRNYRQKQATFNTLSKRFDQPTYLSFRVMFGELGDYYYNGAAGNKSILNYDRMPHPFFGFKQDTDVNNRELYSAINYLIDNNEFTRAKMLEEWISKWNILQEQFQWYFQKIDGIDELLKVDTKKGVRITDDIRLTITALEGLDLRMTHLLQMYKKIVWDDTYQRWVVPEMMRYFTITIYLSEFRTFHRPVQSDGWGFSTNISPSEPGELFLNILDDIIPTWTIKCEMCEIDIENITFDHLTNLGVGDDPNEAGVQFQVKVGKIYEEQVYPTFKNMYLIDKKINGFDRSKEYEITGFETVGVGAYAMTIPQGDIYDSTSAEDLNNGMYNGKLFVGQNLPSGANGADDMHRSTASYNEQKNTKNMFGAGAAGPDGKLFTEDDNLSNIDPTQPNTWLNNALGFGKAFVTNEIESLIDEAKMTHIPGLGVSFTEVQSALESKNIITALGLVRQGMAEVTKDYIGPSELLEGTIDNNFKEFLIGVTQSKATSEINQLLQEAANTALNDDGIWGKIKDFSKATDLVGKDVGEVNSPNPIDIKSQILPKPKDRSTATDLDGGPREIQITQIIESAPSSTATSNQITSG